MRIVHASFLAAASLVGFAWGAAPPSPFEPAIKPLLSAHCVDCHGADLAKANLRLDTLSFDLHDDQTMATWVKVLDKVSAGAMPPKRKDAEKVTSTFYVLVVKVDVTFSVSTFWS